MYSEVVYDITIISYLACTTDCIASLTANSIHSISSELYQLNGSVKEPNISIYFFFPPITQWCSISDVLFTGRRGVSDFNVLK